MHIISLSRMSNMLILGQQHHAMILVLKPLFFDIEIIITEQGHTICKIYLKMSIHTSFVIDMRIRLQLVTYRSGSMYLWDHSELRTWVLPYHLGWSLWRPSLPSVYQDLNRTLNPSLISLTAILTASTSTFRPPYKVRLHDLLWCFARFQCLWILKGARPSKISYLYLLILFIFFFCFYLNQGGFFL